MSEDKNTLANLASKELNDGDNVQLVNEESDEFILSYYMKTVVNDKAIVRIVKAVERMVRTSDEYVKYLHNVRTSTGFQNCSVLGGVDGDNATVEFHHYPFTLYDITQSVLLKNILDKHNFSTFTLARDVISLHFQNKVGIVPLATTVHQMVHTGTLFIPLSFVIGDFVSFAEEFENVFSNKIREKYNITVDKSEKLKESGVDFSILALKPTFLSNNILTESTT